MPKIRFWGTFVVIGFCSLTQAQTTVPAHEDCAPATQPTAAVRPNQLFTAIQKKKAIVDLARAQKAPELSQLEVNFSGVWTDALKFAGKGDSQCMDKVMQKWVEAWKNDVESKLLIRALRFAKQRAFLTDHIVDIFLKTDDVEIARSIAMVMVYSGKPEDHSI